MVLDEGGLGYMLFIPTLREGESKRVAFLPRWLRVGAVVCWVSSLFSPDLVLHQDKCLYPPQVGWDKVRPNG